MEHPYYATELARVLRTEVGPNDVLDLEQTDRLFGVHLDQSLRSNTDAGFAFRKIWKHEPTAPWLRMCQCLEQRLYGEAAVWFAGPYEFCGAINVSADRFLHAAVSILEFDRDTVRLQSVSSDSGLYLDLFEQDSDWLIELVVWGRWRQAAQSCV
jgi:hypothetical protein